MTYLRSHNPWETGLWSLAFTTGSLWSFHFRCVSLDGQRRPCPLPHQTRPDKFHSCHSVETALTLWVLTQFLWPQTNYFTSLSLENGDDCPTDRFVVKDLAHFLNSRRSSASVCSWPHPIPTPTIWVSSLSPSEDFFLHPYPVRARSRLSETFSQETWMAFLHPSLAPIIAGIRFRELFVNHPISFCHGHCGKFYNIKFPSADDQDAWEGNPKPQSYSSLVPDILICLQKHGSPLRPPHPSKGRVMWISNILAELSIWKGDISGRADALSLKRRSF